MTLNMYICKLLRIYNFYHIKFAKMLDIITNRYQIEISSQRDKETFFKQFAKIFTTGKDNDLEPGESETL